jgi:hypothetical protein
VREHLPFALTIGILATLVVALHLPWTRPEEGTRQLERALGPGNPVDRLQDLRRLVALQEGATMPASAGCLELDHPFLRVAEQGADRVVFEATISDKPDGGQRRPWFGGSQAYPYEDSQYWSLTLLEFDREGRLLAWIPFGRE